MNYFSLFSGIGGFELGIQQAIPDSKCIGFSEIDKYAIQCYKTHFESHVNYGSVSEIKDIPDFDLLVGGSPCQDLSICGKREGLAGSQSKLFFEYLRILQEKKPLYFIWENVKGSLSSNYGRDFTIILSELSEAGYNIWWQVLDAQDFGIPQHRERVFIIGFRTKPTPEIFFKSRNDEQNKSKLQEITYNTSDAFRVYSVDGIARTISSQGGGPAGKTGLYSIPDSQIRRLTPLECERCFGFPDNWTSMLSDSQRYKVLGNSVAVPVIKWLIENIVLYNEIKEEFVL